MCISSTQKYTQINIEVLYELHNLCTFGTKNMWMCMHFCCHGFQTKLDAFVSGTLGGAVITLDMCCPFELKIVCVEFSIDLW